MPHIFRPLTLLICLFAFSQCALLKPATVENNSGVVSSELSSLLEANGPDLKYPIYSNFSEIEPIFKQNDGVIYVVNFWATWCRPCIQEMEHFDQLMAETSRKNLQVIMISLDKPEAIRTKMKDFVESRPLLIPTVAFTDNFYDGWIYKVDPAWQRSTIPVTLFYKNGKRYFNKGQINSYRELEGLVDRVR